MVNFPFQVEATLEMRIRTTLTFDRTSPVQVEARGNMSPTNWIPAVKIGGQNAMVFNGSARFDTLNHQANVENDYDLTIWMVVSAFVGTFGMELDSSGLTPPLSGDVNIAWRFKPLEAVPDPLNPPTVPQGIMY